MRKELSPLTSGSHMINYLSTELFIFGDRVGFIHDAMFRLLLQASTEKRIFDTFITVETVPEICHILPTF